jgi:four helix bundle protein
MSRSCGDLLVWQRAMDLLSESYNLAGRLPALERFELASQIRRAAVSVAANIAEGNARSHRPEYLHFLSIARGSLAELRTLLEACRRVNYLSEADLSVVDSTLEHVSKMLAGLIASLSSRPA